MKKLRFYFISLITLVLLSSIAHAEFLIYPSAKVEDPQEVLFGMEVPDPYRWLEKGDSVATKDWINKEDQLTKSYFKNNPFRKNLKKQFQNIYYKNYKTEEEYTKGFIYRISNGIQDRRVIAYKKKSGGKEKVILDMNTMPKTYGLSSWYLTKDEKKIVYAISKSNNDEAILRVRDIETRKDSAIDELTGLTFGVYALSPNNQGVYYIYYPTHLEAAVRKLSPELRYHQFGTSQKEDKLIKKLYQKTTTIIALGIVGDWLFIDATNDEGTQMVVNFFNTKTMNESTKLNIGLHRGNRSIRNDRISFFNLYKGYYYAIEDKWNGSEWVNSISRTPENNLSSKEWETIVSPISEEEILSFTIKNDRIFFLRKTSKGNKVQTCFTDGKTLTNLSTPNNLIVSAPVSQEFSSIVKFTAEDLVTPRQEYEIDSKTLFVKPPPKSSFDSSQYIAQKMTYPSKDGTLIDMYHLRKKTTRIDGYIPTLLYVYGGFASSQNPTFHNDIFPFVNAGGAYVILQVRGGNEKKNWYELGRYKNKQNTFDDVIAAAEYLIKQGYTHSSKLALMGESNGGMVTGAVITQRPDLFRAAFLGAPVLDMPRYPIGSLAGGPLEWGDPKVEGDFKFLLGYSPYHNVENNLTYPSLLFSAGELDDRVNPFHSRKMVALLQNSAMPTENPILLRTPKGEGHNLGAGISSFVEYKTDMFSFLMKELEM